MRWLLKMRQSDRLMPQVREAAIHSDIYGSDHCPELVLDL